MNACWLRFRLKRPRNSGQFEHAIAANGFCRVYTQRYGKRWVVYPSKSTMLACPKKRLRQTVAMWVYWFGSSLLTISWFFGGGVVSGCLRSFPPWPAQSLPFLVKLLGSNIKHLMSKAHDAQIWCTVNLRYISIYFHCCPIHLQIYKEHLPCSGCGGHFPIFIGFHQNTNDKFTSSCWFLLHFSVTVFISHLWKFWSSIEQTSLKMQTLTEKDCHIHIITYISSIIRPISLYYDSTVFCENALHIHAHSKFWFSSHQCVFDPFAGKFCQVFTSWMG